MNLLCEEQQEDVDPDIQSILDMWDEYELDDEEEDD